MPINNITQTISELPAAGRRGVDIQTQFVIKQEDFQDHLQGTTVTELNTFKDQLNARIGEINSTTTTMNGYATTASAGASTATTKAGEASTSASEALTSRNQASTFATNSSNSATKASQWADNNYNAEVETGKYSAKHWSVVAQNTVSGKVDKVTSTDNAIVRFDGTAGAVQNSNVSVDDAGNLGIGVAGAIDGNIHIHTSSGNSNIKFTTGSTGQTSTDGLFVGLNSTGDAYVFNNEGKTLNFGTSANLRMTIDAIGNVGIGVTPNSSTTLPTIFSDYFMTAGMLASYSYVAASYQSGGERYITTGKAASAYVQGNGVHSWSTAPSGTVGNVIPWNTAMTLKASGNLVIGGTTDNGVDKLQVNGIASASRFRSNSLIISAVAGTWVNISTLPDGLHIITQSMYNAATYGACMIVLVAQDTAFIVSNTNASITTLRMSGVTAQINFPITMQVGVSITTLN